MSSTAPDSNPIDNLIDQIDQNTNTNSCCKCLCQSDHIFTISCGHLICLECIEILIDENNYKKCPLCDHLLTKPLQKIYSDFLADPVAKLSYYYNIHIGDVLWWYGGNSHNWLYTKDQCEQLNSAFHNYEEDDEDEVELQIQTGSSMQVYVVDFERLIQWPKTTPDKQRPVSHFKFKSASDLKKNKIIGIAGKLL